MGRDFYGILGVSKSADEKEIRKAYKKAAVKWHPDRNPDNKEEATKKFKEISEAYEVLSDPEKKKLYDQFGEEGVNPKASAGGAGGAGGFSFSDQQAADLFARMFGGRMGGFGNSGPSNVHFSFGGDDEDELGGFSSFFGGMPGGMGGFRNQKRGPRQAPATQHVLQFSLEELYTGLNKKVKITRQVLNEDGRTTRTESEVKAFDVKPGWKSGTKITFEKAGDQMPGTVPADIVFVIQDKPHPLYKREGNDLVHHASISLKEALCGGTYRLKHLDGTTLQIPLDSVISPGSRKVIYGKGMPIAKNPSQKGNLIVTFNVQFPSALSSSQKNQLQNIL